MWPLAVLSQDQWRSPHHVALNIGANARCESDERLPGEASPWAFDHSSALCVVPRAAQVWPQMNADEHGKPTAEEFLFLLPSYPCSSVFICGQLRFVPEVGPLDWSRRTLGGVGIHSPFLHLTIDRRASVWNPDLTGLRPSPPVPYPLKPAKGGLESWPSHATWPAPFSRASSLLVRA